MAHHHKIQASAPAKVIISGEHAAVYGLSALAATLSFRTSVLLSSNRDLSSEPQVTIILDGDRYSFNTQELSQYIPNKVKLSDSSLQQCILSLEPIIPKDREDVRPLVVILLLLTHIISSIIEQFDPLNLEMTIEIESNVPQTIGLGSSAALCTALSTAFLAWFGFISLDPTAEDLQLITKWSRIGEIVFHGTPSGIDTATSTYGKFVAIEKHQPRSIVYPPFKVMVIDSRKRKPPGGTAAAVAMVERRVKSDRTVINKLDQIHGIVKSILASSPAGLSLPDLAELLDQNHLLLNDIGVGFEEAEQIREVCSMHGFVAKITGSGLGGCLLAVQKGIKSDVNALKRDLELAGFIAYEATLGGPGAEVSVIFD
ncbi:hypothetical protein P9112_002373 [Eukaryota sp. TZLM1-RC]